MMRQVLIISALASLAAAQMCFDATEVAGACTAGTDLGYRVMSALYQCDTGYGYYARKEGGDEDWHTVLDRRGLRDKITVTVSRILRTTATCTPLTDCVSGRTSAGTISPTSAGSTSSSTSRTSTAWPPRCLSSSSGTGRWETAGTTPPATSINTSRAATTLTRTGPLSPVSSTPGVT